MSPAMVERCTPVEPSNPTDKAQTFTSLFDRPLIDSTSIRSMDESNSFQFPPVSSSGKPSLSKPRFFKVRKNAPHRKPSAAATQEPAADSAFNPFRSEKNEVIPESGARVSESSNASFRAGAFVFGSGSPNLSRNLGVKSEGEPSLAQEAGMGRSFSFGSEGRGDSSSNLFVFGSGVQKNGDSSRDSSLGSDESLIFSKLMVDTMKSGVERGKQTENVFVFGGSGVDNRSTDNTEPSISSASFTSERSVRPDAGNFVFGSGVRKSANFSWDSPLGLNESKLAEETRKLNLNNPDDVGELEEMKKQAENVFIFGGSTSLNRLSESSGSSGSASSDVSVFEFGRGATKSADLSQNSSLGSEKGSFSLFADQMRKLNVDYFEKQQQAESAFSFGSSKNGSGISDGDNVNKLSDSARVASKPETTGLEKPAASSAGLGSNTAGEAGAFPFGSQVNKDDDFNAKLPDEMKKMNLSCGDDDGKAESADGDFAFGVSKSLTDSSKYVVPNKAAEEDAKLNVGNGAIGSAAGAFVFGSNTAKSSIASEATPSTLFHNRAASDLPNDKKSSSEDLDKDKEMGYKEKVDVGNGFAFGSSASASASFVESAFSTLHDDLEKMKIGSETGKLAGNNPFKSAFQEGDLCNKGSIPSFGSTFTFLRKSGGLETHHMEFKTPKQDTAWLTKESLFMGTDQSVPFSVKKCDAKSARAKKKRGKSKQPAPLQQNLPKHFIPVERESQENREEGSPMDCSPYCDETVADQCSREPSVVSVDSIHFSSRGSSVDTQRSVSLDERGEVQVSTAAEKLKINEGDLCQEEGGDTTNERVKRSSSDDSASADEQISRQDEEKDIPKNENVGFDSNLRTGSAEAETGSFTSNIEGPASEGGTGFTFSTTLADNGGTNFTFSASTSAQDPLSASKHNYKRSSRSKSGQPVSTANARVRSASPLPDLIPPFDTSRLPDLAGLKSASSVAQSEDESKPGKCKESEVRQESTSSAAPGVAAREACEKWRFRGNQAYADGLLSKAEDYYTRGINSVSRREIPSSCIQPLTLCYSNRAATRMSLGRMREALSDCKVAVLIDPNFLKARLRIGNCLLALGEIGEASKQFKKCMQLEKDINTNQKYISEATDGLQKAQQVGDLTGQAAELLLKRTLNDASKAFNMISEALAISPHSESLMEMKAEALLVMRNYEEVIQVCERTLNLAEINSSMIEADSQDCSGFMKSSSAKVWRWHLIAKSYFYLGKLDEALELLEREEMIAAVDRYMNGSAESSTAFADTVRELLRLKSAGNEAFQAGRHSEAVEYYTAALACNAESRPFSAVCLCNRAAAYQALGQITEAIADCSLAIALDASYPKAISRRATLHEMIRDYGHAANDLNRLISLLENQVGEKFNQSGAGGRSTTNVTDLKRARARLAAVEEEARKGISLNMYMILGVEPTSSAADIKKAYRKAALKHHPDKAGQVIVRNENVDDGLWKEVAAEVQADADRLFKMIGEAYTILSDPKKRLEYDDEEEMRTTPRKSYGSSYGHYGSSTPRTSSDGYTSYYEKNFNRRQWQARGSSYQQW